jgi:transcriptional regulator with XRE-family HTH domain
MDAHPLQSYRERAGLTLDVLAERVGVSKATLSRIENRKQAPSLDLVSKLKAASGGEVSADDFLPADPAESSVA